MYCMQHRRVLHVMAWTAWTSSNSCTAHNLRSYRAPPTFFKDILCNLSYFAHLQFAKSWHKIDRSCSPFSDYGYYRQEKVPLCTYGTVQPPTHHVRSLPTIWMRRSAYLYAQAQLQRGGVGKRRRRKSLLPPVLTLGYCRRAGVFTVCAEEKEDHGPLKSAEALCTTTLREIRAAVQINSRDEFIRPHQKNERVRLQRYILWNIYDLC